MCGFFARNLPRRDRIHNAELVMTMVYGNFSGWRRRKNKPNRSQFQNVAGGDLAGGLVFSWLRRKGPKRILWIFFKKLPVMILTLDGK